MQGFLKYHIPVWIRRGVTMAPALIVIFAGLDPTRSLVLSQVVLSFGLPFAVIPLIWFTSRRRLMGPLVNARATVILSGLAAALIVALNLFLLYRVFAGD
jgi:manganese transport protein